MSRRNHSINMKVCTCSKCSNKAHTIPGTTHRRCPGQLEQAIVPKHEGIEPAKRGTWG